MPNLRPHDSDGTVVADVWDPQWDQRCIVCNRPSGGKAICGDQRCAEELARG